MSSPLSLRRARDKHRDHERHASVCGVPFTLSFEQWWDIWQASGHWHQRGVGRGWYVLARNDKAGGFELGNVRVCLWEENAALRRGNGWSGRKHTLATRRKLAALNVTRQGAGAAP